MFNPKVTLPLALTTLLAGAIVNAQPIPGTPPPVETVPGRTTIIPPSPGATTIQGVPGTTTTETTTTTTTAVGLVSEWAPEGFVVRTESGMARYGSSPRTVFVDEAGRPVGRELVTTGLPVTVHYSRVGERFVADRVIVRRQATTGEPTVIERNTTITNPPVIIEKKVPVIVEKKVYVDRPVVVEKKVFVDRPVDRPVIVEKPVIIEKPVPAPKILRETTITTTTTTGKKEKDKDKDDD